MVNYYRFPCPVCGAHNMYLAFQILGSIELYCSIDTEEEHKYTVPEEIKDKLIKFLERKEVDK